MNNNFLIHATLSLGIAGMLSGCTTTPKMTENLNRENRRDTVSGATNSSHVIINAAQPSLNEACGE